MINKKRNMHLLIVFVVALVIGIGYAILSNNLNIAGSTKIKDNTWNVHFENINVASGSVSAPTPTIQNGTNVTYTVTLNMPGDFYEFTVDAKNGGSIDAMIGSISNTGLTDEQKKYMEYSATYSDSVNIEEKQELKANTKETIKVRVKFRKDIDASALPTEVKTLNLTLNMNYVQANNTSKIVRNIVCKRATTLHNDGTNTYGNLGTTGTLASGDAFDCDVNGDGEYNSQTERFYYVTDLDTDNNYGVLIYYDNVSDGIPNHSIPEGGYYIPEFMGPYDLLDDIDISEIIQIKSELPTTLMWKNVSLSNTIRKIKDQLGNEYKDLSYAGYAARFLTYQEVVSACGIGNPTSDGYLNSCKYFIENNALYWLENTYFQNINEGETEVLPLPGMAWIIGTNSIEATAEAFYVRPVIEVPKSKISY